ncbi:putative lipopolysaccharide biosynthesis protein [Thermodesulfatator indicus DSM 15286]|uniref:Lipopolysaccharide biosynthesis protein n=1 Tax=Thermodesulfatator indicus (strain DSM 15286 / JCM 11887 / CIR29812) TaxID=667014 RepID=F8A9B9_THEID|nr:oligosaccharide flippase family protein [Thermodesulfatator indicus]AEH45614.1 putative lipopolysaccharide biosynthesis protein [Thermodesulfatator indicus DSM 15286]
MAEESLGIKAGRAALWQVAGGGWQTLVRLGASIYLARALKPSDFGLFGMALLYQELIVMALSMGFGTCTK